MSCYTVESTTKHGFIFLCSCNEARDISTFWKSSPWPVTQSSQLHRPSEVYAVMHPSYILHLTFSYSSLLYQRCPLHCTDPHNVCVWLDCIIAGECYSVKLGVQIHIMYVPSWPCLFHSLWTSSRRQTKSTSLQSRHKRTSPTPGCDN